MKKPARLRAIFRAGCSFTTTTRTELMMGKSRKHSIPNKQKKKQPRLTKVDKISWNEGDKVKLAYDVKQRGKVIRAGPEVSEVKFEDGKSRFIINELLTRG